MVKEENLSNNIPLMKDRGTRGRDWFKDIVSHSDKGIIEQMVELNG